SMVPSRDRCAPQSQHTDALLQRSQQRQSRIGHAKSDCRFIKHVKLRLFQRYIEPDILRHWLLSGCCVATTKLYPSRNKSSVIGPRDYHHVLQYVRGGRHCWPRLLCRFDLTLSANSTSWRIASEREGLSGCCFAQVSIADLNAGERRIADTGSLPVAGRP